jgi:hypothetical protein
MAGDEQRPHRVAGLVRQRWQTECGRNLGYMRREVDRRPTGETVPGPFEPAVTGSTTACKRHKHPRQTVRLPGAALKLQSTGAQKGVAVAVTGFQSCAPESPRPPGRQRLDLRHAPHRDDGPARVHRRLL